MNRKFKLELEVFLDALRWYQTEGIDSVINYYGGKRPDGSRKKDNVLVSVPPGGGKTMIGVGIIAKVLEKAPDCKFLCLTHSRDLIIQNEAAQNKWFPSISTGVYMAGLNRKEAGRQISFGAITSVYKLAELFQDIKVLIVDECHRIPRSARSMYLRFISELKEYNPNIIMVGLSANMQRGDSGLLTEGKDALFKCVVYEANWCELTKQGYLSPLLTRTGSESIDVSKIRIVGNDFHKGDLEKEADKEVITQSVIDDLEKYWPDRKTVIAFCSGKNHVRHVVEALVAAGHSAEGLTDDTSPKDRDRILADSKSGKLRVLVNISIAGIGVDIPRTDLILLIRAYHSPNPLIQAGGRGTRLSPATGKKDCIIADYGQNLERFGPFDKIKVKPKVKGDGNGTAPLKLCLNCYAENPVIARVCSECGGDFPPPKHGLTLSSSTAAVLSDQKSSIEEFDVDSVTYRRWQKKGKELATLRVDYHCGYDTISDWVCIEHGGYAGDKAYKWWMDRDESEDGFFPGNAHNAVSQSPSLKKPTKIKAHKEGKFWAIDECVFSTNPRNPEAKPEKSGVNDGDSYAKGSFSSEDVPF